ncbi:MAG: inositol monophosphatase family protein [Candidatus Lokiarchaeota archaeon]
MSEYKREMEFLEEVINRSIEISIWFKDHRFEVFKKSDNSLVTSTDLAIQIYIIKELKDRFPNDQIIAEESSNFGLSISKDLILKCYKDLNIKINNQLAQLLGNTGEKGDRKWTIDPIDGSIGYKKGLTYAIGLSLLVGKDVKCAIIGVPKYINKETTVFKAEKNKSAFSSINFGPYKKIGVSKQSQLSQVVLAHSLHHDKPWVREFADKVGIDHRIRIDSMAKYCMVADSSIDLYLRPLSSNRSYSWDFAPGDLIVREAGGLVTQLNGDPLIYNNKTCVVTSKALIVSNSLLYEKTMKILDQII